jgi:hypothetical protein
VVDGDEIGSRVPDADSCRDRLLDVEGIVEYYASSTGRAWSFEVDSDRP